MYVFERAAPAAPAPTRFSYIAVAYNVRTLCQILKEERDDLKKCDIHIHITARRQVLRENTVYGDTTSDQEDLKGDDTIMRYRTTTEFVQ
jgi:hypothetical protein